MKEKNLQPRLLYPARISFKYEGEIKSFTDKQRLREFWDNIKRPNIQIIGVPEEDKKKDHEKILEIIVENFPKLGNEIITQVQETERVPNRINPR